MPVEETLQALEYTKYERDKNAVKQYFEDVMPFSESTSIKYRQRLFERFITIDNGQVAYTPFLNFINEVESYQTKKELLFIMTVFKTVTLQIVLKDIYHGRLKSKFTKSEFMDYLQERMTTHKITSIEKTHSTLIKLFKEFNIITVQEDYLNNEIFIINERIRPTNETVAFCLYFEFFERQDNRIPNQESLYNADCFKYLLIDRFLAERYVKWLITNNYLEYFRMGSNEQYQFTCSSLDDFVNKVITNAQE